METYFKIIYSLLIVFVISLTDVVSQTSQIEFIQSFGSEDFDANSTYSAGGEIFSRISSISVNDHYLYVLDSHLQKIAVFERESGELIKVSLGGYGRGPGEFELPLSISSGDDNNFIVYDYGNRKISFFDLEDGVYNEVKVPYSSRSIAQTNEFIWIGAMNHFDNYVYSFRKDETPVNTAAFDEHIDVSQAELEYAVNGVISFVDNFNNDGIIMASHIPSIWYKIGNGNIEKFGKPVHPDSKATIGRDGVRSIENHVAGICYLDNKYVVVMWIHFPERGDQRHVALDVYSSNGSYIDRIKIKDKIYSNIACTRNSNRIYLATTSPYPRVEEFRFVSAAP